jgi:hypothetical protein
MWGMRQPTKSNQRRSNHMTLLFEVLEASPADEFIGHCLCCQQEFLPTSSRSDASALCNAHVASSHVDAVIYNATRNAVSYFGSDD